MVGVMVDNLAEQRVDSWEVLSVEQKVDLWVKTMVDCSVK